MQAIRNSFKVIRQKYKRIGKKNVRLTQSTLLLIQPIKGTTDTYKFPILESDNSVAPQPEELRLNINDEFISYDVSYYVIADVAIPATVDTAAVPQGKFYLTYAPIELDRSTATMTRAWDGFLQILVNKISRLEKWDLKKHNMIPRTQFQNFQVGQPFATQPSSNYAEDGTKAMQPMLTLSGAKKNDIIITLTNGAVPNTSGGLFAVPSGAIGSTANLQYTLTRLGLLFRGMLAQNASKFQ